MRRQEGPTQAPTRAPGGLLRRGVRPGPRLMGASAWPQASLPSMGRAAAMLRLPLGRRRAGRPGPRQGQAPGRGGCWRPPERRGRGQPGSSRRRPGAPLPAQRRPAAGVARSAMPGPGSPRFGRARPGPVGRQLARPTQAGGQRRRHRGSSAPAAGVRGAAARWGSDRGPAPLGWRPCWWRLGLRGWRMAGRPRAGRRSERHRPAPASPGLLAARQQRVLLPKAQGRPTGPRRHSGERKKARRACPPPRPGEAWRSGRGRRMSVQMATAGRDRPSASRWKTDEAPSLPLRFGQHPYYAVRQRVAPGLGLAWWVRPRTWMGQRLPLALRRGLARWGGPWPRVRQNWPRAGRPGPMSRPGLGSWGRRGALEPVPMRRSQPRPAEEPGLPPRPRQAQGGRDRQGLGPGPGQSAGWPRGRRRASRVTGLPLQSIPDSWRLARASGRRWPMQRPLELAAG